MLMSHNNNKSMYPFANGFNQSPLEVTNQIEEKLDQLPQGVPSYPSHQQQFQQQYQQQFQQPFQPHYLVPQQHQQQQQTQAQFQHQNINFNQGFNPLDTMQPQSAHSLHNMMNPNIFSPSINNFIVGNGNGNGINNNNSCHNPFEPAPIFEKQVAPVALPTTVVSSTPATFAASSSAELPKCMNKTKMLLPEGFVPCDKTIICGNKRKYFQSKGNLRFRSVCKMFINAYMSAPTKVEKSAVVSQVMAILREGCMDGGMSVFVTPQGSHWYAVSERTAREKVGTFFRDCLSDTYKSSAKNKIAKRKLVKSEKSSSAASSTASSNHQNQNKINKKATKAEMFPENDEGSLGSCSFYDVNDFTPVRL